MSQPELEIPDLGLPECVKSYEVKQLGDQLIAIKRSMLPGELSAAEALRLQSILRHPTEESLNSWARESGVGLVGEAFWTTEQGEISSEPEMVIGAAMVITLATAAMIDNSKVKNLGVNAGTGGSNALISKSTEYAGWDVADAYLGWLNAADDDSDNKLHHVQHVAKHLQEDKRHGAAWFAPKMIEFAVDVLNARDIMRHLVSLGEEVDESEAEGLKAENDALFKELRALQRYGLKNAIAPSLNEGQAIHNWLFMDRSLMFEVSHDRASDAGSKYQFPEAAAIIVGAAEDFQTARPAMRDMMSHTHKSVGIAGFSSQDLGLGHGNDTFVTLQLDRSGQLRMLHGARLEELCRESGASAAYEALRSEILAIYFDMVVPVIVQKTAEDEASTLHPGVGEPEEKAPKLRRLVLARRRVLEILGDDVKDLIEDEAREGADEVLRRRIKNHPVTWCIRKLPSNFKASLAARERCLQETGIVLAEFGETYVRPHNRGEGEYDDLGHKAVMDVGKAATFLAEKRAKKFAKPKPGRYTPPKSRR